MNLSHRAHSIRTKRGFQHITETLTSSLNKPSETGIWWESACPQRTMGTRGRILDLVYPILSVLKVIDYGGAFRDKAIDHNVSMSPDLYFKVTPPFLERDDRWGVLFEFLTFHSQES